MTRVRLALPLLALLVAGSAAAQTSALRSHDTDAPIDFDAARIEVLDQENQALLTGNVQIRQGSLQLDAERLRIHYRQTGQGDPTVLRLDAEGGVRLTSPSERASARYGVYDVEDRQITLVGNVVLNRGDSILRGQRLAIDLVSGRSTLDGAGRSAPGAAATTGGRVTGRFVVPERRPQQ